ncbi:MAG TPA: cysteine peptidase family C39 domain-containing protein [Ktedonobacteraceae bacterium]|nr:cysteine peptidase family C39 domain-containing protein [Ktedonobacteraceae bacterium]
MPFLLLMLLAIFALVVTLVGFFLSSNSNKTPQIRNEQLPVRYRASNSSPYGERRMSRQLRQVDTEPILLPRVVQYTEQRPLLGLWQLLTANPASSRRTGKPTPWMGITLVLLSIFLLGILLMKTLMPNATLIGAISWPSVSSQPSTNQQNSPSETYIGASQALIRLGQLDPSQYNSSSEYNIWAYSACSAAAMAEVFNAYGHHYRVTDILKVESAIGEITPQQGLLEDVGIQRTAARFNFSTTLSHKLSLNAILDIANHGRPVIVSFPPDRYAGGHLLVVLGGSGDYVYLADSSLYNRHSLTRAQFMNWWEGFSAIVTPNSK